MADDAGRAGPSLVPTVEERTDGQTPPADARRPRARVLVLGQLPPPYLGQPIMLEQLLSSPMADVELRHARMALSTSSNEVGRFRWRKVLGLAPILWRIVWGRWIGGADILYFTPGGPNRVSMFRDFVVLIPTRWMFRKTIFHFEASGVSDLYPRLPAWQKWLFRLAYFHADAGVRLSELTPDDARLLRAKREYVIANGIQDPCPDFAVRQPTGEQSPECPLRLLFVAALRESKGLLVLVEACGELAARGIEFQLDVMGQFESPQFAARVNARLVELKLASRVRFLGMLTGAEKLAAYAAADVFCLPTFYECEAFPVVLVEAAAFGLPVVSTRWRGIPSIVDDGATGLLVEPHDPLAVADKLAALAGDARMRRRMSLAARARYLRELSLAHHLRRMRQMFLDVAGGAALAPAAAESCDQFLAVPVDEQEVESMA